MRIGILAEGFMEWGGGVDFLRMICDCLRLAMAEDPPTLVLLTPRTPTSVALQNALVPWYQWAVASLSERKLKPLREVICEQRSLSPAYQLARVTSAIGNQIPVRFFRSDEELDAVARMEELDCLLPSFRALSTSVRTRWVGYIYDFQHRHLPDLFSTEEREIRDARFHAMAHIARTVIVNSRSVREDCVRFFGTDNATFVALPFGAAPAPDWFEDQPLLIAKYHLPQRYFLVSNQFWTHKNHRVVFEALHVLTQNRDAADVAVVCTGSTVDARDRNYFPSLQQYLRENQLAEKVRILDFIPKRDQIEIMKRAVAVIQPTLFEGGPGGGAVYDAIALDVPALVSDIPVNRELEGQEFPIQFFAPTNAQELAGLMLERLRRPTGKRKDATTLIEAGQLRRRAVGEVLARTIQAAGATTRALS
jgi:glycosyltransferase involved in cell wall biosynthesis